jgi:hypothetical protein
VVLICLLWGYFLGVGCGRNFGWGGLLFLGIMYMIGGVYYNVSYMYLCMWRCKIGVMLF